MKTKYYKNGDLNASFRYDTVVIKNENSELLRNNFRENELLKIRIFKQNLWDMKLSPSYLEIKTQNRNFNLRLIK